MYARSFGTNDQLPNDQIKSIVLQLIYQNYNQINFIQKNLIKFVRFL